MEEPVGIDEVEACLRGCDCLQAALGLVEVVADGSGRPHDVRFLRVNGAFAALCGLAVEDLTGRSSRQFNPVMAPFALEEFDRAARGQATLCFEKYDRVLGKWLEVKAAPCGGGRLMVLIADVSARRKLEAELEATRERLQSTLEHAPSGICVAEHPPDGRITYLNATSVAITGYEPGDVRTLREWHERAFPDPAYRAEVVEGLRRDLEDGYRSRKGIYRVTCRDGTVKELQFRATILPDGTLLTFVNDMSGIRQAESRGDRLQALALRLTEAEEGERRRIVELLHDDLQQLLAGARFQLEPLVRDSGLDEATREAVGKAGRLIEESLRKTRLLSHDLSPPVLRQADLGSVLEWLARHMEETLGLRVRVQCGGPLPVDDGTVRAFLFRAVRELLFNAAKHAGVSEAAVSVQRGAGRLEITVSDRGRGFDPREALGGRGAAGGLGLNSIGERAALFGGSLRAESEPGMGSRFVLSLPLAGPPRA